MFCIDHLVVAQRVTLQAAVALEVVPAVCREVQHTAVLDPVNPDHIHIVIQQVVQALVVLAVAVHHVLDHPLYLGGEGPLVSWIDDE